MRDQWFSSRKVSHGPSTRGASDALLPFPDSPESAAKAEVAAIIQPGGSVRVEEVIAVVDRYNLAMVFTGDEAFQALKNNGF